MVDTAHYVGIGRSLPVHASRWVFVMPAQHPAGVLPRLQTPVEKCGGWRPQAAAPVAPAIVLPRLPLPLLGRYGLGQPGAVLLEALKSPLSVALSSTTVHLV